MNTIEQRPHQTYEYGHSPIIDPVGVIFSMEFTHKRNPSGTKKERRKGKLPNEIRHDQNAAISVGTWKNKGREKDKTSKK
jgi:hypothetical protein